MRPDLVEYEIQVMEMMAGERDDLQWGGAMGAALEFLKGRRMVFQHLGRYDLTPAGRAYLAARKLATGGGGDAGG